MALEVCIRKRYPEFCLDVSFSTGEGFLGILGPSGCGKSLALKCIAGVETPDEGYITVDGRVLFDSSKKINLRPQQRGVGYLFQSYALFPHMTAAENIACALRLPKKKKWERVRELVGQFRLEGLETHYPHQMSGGQQQRTAICRMLAGEPGTVLLDEPFSALDSHLREQLQLQLEQTLRGYPNVVLVTHNRDEAYRLCRELAVMEGGRIGEQGATRELFRNPGSLASARLTGCKNISRARRRGRRELEALDWGILLRTEGDVGEETAYVGIRAHDLVPVGEGGTHNRIRAEYQRRYEDPFEWNVLLTNADAPEAEAGVDRCIWWKYSKQLAMEPPPYLELPPGALLLLKE